MGYDILFMKNSPRYANVFKTAADNYIFVFTNFFFLTDYDFIYTRYVENTKTLLMLKAYACSHSKIFLNSIFWKYEYISNTFCRVVRRKMKLKK